MTAAKKITYADRPAQVSSDAGKIRLLGDQIIFLYDFIRDAREESKTASGLLYVPKNATQPAHSETVWGTVIAVGPGRYLDKFLDRERGTSQIGSSAFLPMELKAGDRIAVMGPLCGDAVMIDGLEHRICCADVALLVEESDAAR